MQQEASVKDIANRIQQLAQNLDRERFLPIRQTEKDEQSKRLGALKIEADQIVDDIVRLLHLSSSRKKVIRWVLYILRRRQFTGIDRANLGIHLVNASLLRLQTRLLITRTDANRSWLEQSVNAPEYRLEVRVATKQFETTLRKAPIALSALNYRTIASAIRSWSDETSVPATQISGWLEAAIPVSRDLRFLANYYHTRWLWKSVTDSHTTGGFHTRGIFLIKAVFDSAFRILSGYGLRGRRFIASLFSIVLFFSVALDLIDVLNGCRTWWDIAGAWTYVMTSAAYLVGNGPAAIDMRVDAACPAAGNIVSGLGVLETGVGYLMLGIFVSLLWSVIQRRSIDTSRLALPIIRSKKEPDPPQIQVALSQQETVLNVANNETSVRELEVPTVESKQL